MRLQMFKSKIHRATVTHADLDYEGSVSIDEELMDAAGVLEYEAVHIWNITRGTRLMTYALKAERGSGIVCINGAAAHLNKPGDLVILATFAELEAAEATDPRPQGRAGRSAEPRRHGGTTRWPARPEGCRHDGVSLALTCAPSPISPPSSRSVDQAAPSRCASRSTPTPRPRSRPS